MKKLTDEIVAKALGWKHVNPCSGKRVCKWIKPLHYACGDLVMLPHFTTSLDAIVAEIEARGLMYTLIWIGVGKDRAVVTIGIYLNGDGLKTGIAKTAPLALCHALLAYLKSTPTNHKSEGASRE